MKTTGEIIDAIAARTRGGAMLLIRNGVRAIAAYSWPRRVLNALYIKLTSSQKSIFHRELAKIFRSGSIRPSSGIWRVVFVNKSILMPLTSERFWLDWDTAVSIVGHDIEVKETYESLIGSPERPELFIDIGANYGTHSLLFLVHGIQTITFEPNASCQDYFIGVCRLNRVTPILEPVALGDRQGYVELSYPISDTWLGSTDSQVTERLALSHELVIEKVEQKTVDDYFAEIGHKRALIKVDTEGNEISVLRGATRTLREHKPKIVFECWHDGRRKEIFDFLVSESYAIYHLPWNPADGARPITRDRFITSRSSNFIAVSSSDPPRVAAGQ